MPSPPRLSALRLAACMLVVPIPLPMGCPNAPLDRPLKSAEMLECSGLPCVDVASGAGASVRMLIGTGNVVSVLDKAAAQRLGLKLGPFTGLDGKVHPEYATATLAHVRVGGASLGDIPVVVMDIAAGVKKGDRPDAEGTLAYTAFEERLLRLDYQLHRVELSVRGDLYTSPKNKGWISLPTFGQQGQPMVVTSNFRVNGRPIKVQVDTLFAGTLLIYPESVDRLGLSAQKTASSVRLFPFTDGGVQMIEGQAERIQFGETELAEHARIYFATDGVRSPDGMFDGTVGQELFAGHVLTIDLRSRHFWID